MAILTAGSTALPSPTELSTSNEIIWSSNTGRSADGTMLGDVVAEKKDVNITWGILTESEVATIESCLVTGFFPITFRDGGSKITITTYRGSLQKEHLGYIGDGIYYYKSVTAEIIQQ